jgi:hypothetical protein
MWLDNKNHGMVAERGKAQLGPVRHILGHHGVARQRGMAIRRGMREARYTGKYRIRV